MIANLAQTAVHLLPHTSFNGLRAGAKDKPNFITTTNCHGRISYMSQSNPNIHTVQRGHQIQTGRTVRRFSSPSLTPQLLWRPPCFSSMTSELRVTQCVTHDSLQYTVQTVQFKDIDASCTFRASCFFSLKGVFSYYVNSKDAPLEYLINFMILYAFLFVFINRNLSKLYLNVLCYY